MNDSIIINLLKNKYLKYGTHIKARYLNKDNFGLPTEGRKVFRFLRVTKQNDRVLLYLSDIHEPEKVVMVDGSCIEEIDGMDQQRFLFSYNLDEHGSRIVKKRNRKKKNEDDSMVLIK